jgi:hypothetical protein
MRAVLLPAVICLGAASVSDIRQRKVADLTWWIMAVSGLLLLPFETEGPGLTCFTDCLFVIFIQEHIMCRAYGRADSHAFSCCALFFCFAGYGLEAHILHMCLSLGFLTIIQLIGGNIRGNGKLRHPVAFIPYISVSFLVVFMIK